MKKTRFTEEQLVTILREADAKPVPEVARKHGVSAQTTVQVTLSEQLQKGPVVLAFFPAAFTGVCTKEMCTFRDSVSDLNNVGATVLGVSTDTFFTLKAWADQNAFKFPLLSDYNKEVIAHRANCTRTGSSRLSRGSREPATLV